MLITLVVCLTIINWLMAGSGIRETGGYYHWKFYNLKHFILLNKPKFT